ncbi:DUF2169 domain-containing protein [uncultured Martelella sp.]|uniref:DUF2169 domain-containing protein n=1 Tax=uncultured Martelella sp. TaxID=392331 RepID=UPI0029C71228|nr:DUF2169 domain-containing protein [uncultured Martelella sp.]
MRQPQGFAPVTPVWRFRQQYAGTYDESWLETRHPFLPFDFDYRFYNCAHPDMIFSPFLKGGERVELVNLHPEQKRIVLKLPTLSPTAIATRENGTETHAGLNLDGVHFNLVAKPPTLRLTWRRAFMWQDGISRITLADAHGQDGKTTPAIPANPDGEETEAAS